MAAAARARRTDRHGLAPRGARALAEYAMAVKTPKDLEKVVEQATEALIRGLVGILQLHSDLQADSLAPGRTRGARRAAGHPTPNTASIDVDRSKSASIGQADVSHANRATPSLSALWSPALSRAPVVGLDPASRRRHAARAGPRTPTAPRAAVWAGALVPAVRAGGTPHPGHDPRPRRAAGRGWAG